MWMEMWVVRVMGMGMGDEDGGEECIHKNQPPASLG